jgi:hypothetical protein
MIRPDQDVTQFVAYENLTPLDRIQFAEAVFEKTRYYVVRIRASDGSDPRTNGRHYWLVRLAK